MLILTVLLACDTGPSSSDDTGADTGMVDASDAPGGQEGEELIGDTGDVDTDGSDSSALSTSDTAVTFGTQLVGCSTEESVTVSNATSAPITLESVLADAGDELSVTTQPLPMVLSPGDSVAFTVRYAPISEGSLSSTLSVYTDQGIDAELSLVGDSALYAPGKDTFEAEGDTTSFGLSQSAVSQTLSVTIDGTPLPETEWSLTGQQLLLTTAVPAGAIVTVDYAVQPPSCD